MKRPLVTFYMQAYNTEKYIEQSIESILNQSVSNIEFILVNNASTDRTGEICRRYAEKDSRIKYQENEKNTFLNPDYQPSWIPPSGEYVGFLDSDDYINLNFVKIMYRKAKKQNADMIVCGTEMFMEENPDSKNIRIPPALVTSHLPMLADYFEKLYGSLRPLWAKLYRTEFYLEHGSYAFDKPVWLKSGGDTFSVLRFLQKCQSFVSIDRVLHHYRIHESSLYHKLISPDRLLECDCLYNEGMELLKKWNAVNTDHTTFLYNVHAASILDYLDNIEKNTTIALEERLSLIQHVTINDLFNQYALTDLNWERNFDMIEKMIARILTCADIKDDYGRFYIVRLFRALKEKNSNGKSVFLAFLLSAICDPQNKHHLGIEWLKKHISILPENLKMVIKEAPDMMPTLFNYPKILREIINGDLENALKSVDFEQKFENIRDIIQNMLRKSLTSIDRDSVPILKEKLVTCVQTGNLEEAIPLLAPILEQRFLDREGLYYKIFIAWEIGDTTLALDTAEIAMIFWTDEPEMVALCGDLFAAAGIKKRAEEVYSLALEVDNNPVFIADISERIKAL